MTRNAKKRGILILARDLVALFTVKQLILASSGLQRNFVTKQRINLPQKDFENEKQERNLWNETGFMFSECVVTQSESIHQYPDQTNCPSHG